MMLEVILCKLLSQAGRINRISDTLIKEKTKTSMCHISPHLSTTGVQADDWINCPPKAE